MKKPTLRILIFFSIFVFKTGAKQVDQSKPASAKVCRDLAPKICDYYNSFLQNITKETLLCKNEFNNKSMLEMRQFYRKCIESHLMSGDKKYSFWMMIKSPSGWPIINESLRIFQFYETLNWSFRLVLMNFKGFDIESRIRVRDVVLKLKTEFNLYKNKRIVKSCEDFANSKSTGFIFQQTQTFYDDAFWLDKIMFYSIKLKYPICSLFFKNARIISLVTYNMANTFYLRSVLAFTDPHNSSRIKINSSVLNFIAQDIYGIDLDSKTLNPHVFRNLQSIMLTGNLNSIESTVFKPFKKIKLINFELYFLMPVIRKQGIGWIKAINSDLNAHLTNRTDLNLHERKRKVTYRSHEFWSGKYMNAFYEEDFCLSFDFPFNQMVILKLSENFQILSKLDRNFKFTCTELWLMRFYREFSRLFSVFRNLLSASDFSQCFIEKRINLCKKVIFSSQKN